jgi:tetratricopeptide (TPR) repeat protein
MPDLYAPCPCGSGKKFKWCCQHVYAGIQHALEQDANGQHETALRIIDEVAREHPRNPEVWGQRARLLSNQGKGEQAEESLQKAFDLNPNYPFGLLLRALFRYHEGELRGALLLARRAADAFDPQARDHLSSVYRLIFESEWKANRPVAARAALRLVTHYQPADEQTRDVFDRLFGPKSQLPACARRDYTFRSPPTGMPGPRRAAWDQALRGAAANPRLSELARTFEELTKAESAEAAAWFNLALSRAWLGDNAAALEALNVYLEREADGPAAAEAAALAEVLRCGQGQEEECDYKEHICSVRLRDPQPVNALLEGWLQAHRLVPIQTDQENVFTGLLLELSSSTLITVGSPAADAGRLAGYLLITGDRLQITSPVREPFDRLEDELRERLALGLGELQQTRRPISWRDVTAEALLFPLRGAEEEKDAARVLEHAQRYYEETWIHRPRNSLAGNTSVDAAAHPTLRKKLRGVISFIEDCAAGSLLAKYEFDRLRRKLGLQEAAAAPAGAAADISALGAAELAGLSVAELSNEQLEQAYQAARRLDADELTAHFARARVARPEAGDLYPWYAHLIDRSLREGDSDAALDLVNEGEKADCERNEGRRRNDYELRRGQVHTRRGEPEQAGDVFGRLIERAPDNLRYRGQAAEAMLKLQQPQRALRFAEEGLAEARRQNNRDAEQHLLEVAEAARKKIG